MLVQRLKVTSFRLFDKKHLELSPGINVILGPNAQGKTTLLEAIYLLIAGRSFRTNQIKEMTREGDSHFHVELHFAKNGIDQLLKMAVQQELKRIQHNRTLIPNLSSLLGIVQGVLLSPGDLELVRGSPQCRRQYIDLQIAQVDPLYVHHLIRYSKSLKARNSLLKIKQLKAIAAFEETMAPSALYIMHQREFLIEKLKAYLSQYYQTISGKKESVMVTYTPSWGGLCTVPEIAAKLEQQRSKELQLGFSLSGPHRDDLKIEIDHKEARLFASEGEVRSLVAALRLAEWKRMADVTGDQPLLLVDDFGMNLINLDWKT